jgi:DNA-binding beta-propeller fold protein YncE
MRFFTHLMYTAVAISLLLAATILVAPMSITNSIFKPAQAEPFAVEFDTTDEPGPWFKNISQPGLVDAVGTQSLALVAPGDTVRFTIGSNTNTVHTGTSLLWPAEAEDDGFEPVDQPEAFKGGSVDVVIPTEGLYAFVCKLHPFMLAAVIADSDNTDGLNLGKEMQLVTEEVKVPTASDLSLRIIRAFFVITNPDNWQVFSASGPTTWDPTYTDVPVTVHTSDGTAITVNPNDFFDDYFEEGEALPALFKPKTKGVGEIWIATQYEETENRGKPGTLTVVDAKSWKVDRKVSLPDIENEMNNPHNMWTDRDQTVIYTTQWFDQYLTTIDRKSGEYISNVWVGEAPAHVMTRTNTDQVHVSLNGEDSVAELEPGGGSVEEYLDVTGPDSNPAQPHAHWMGYDGMKMVTPNSNTKDSTLYSFAVDGILAKEETGMLPIATGMMPDSSKYYVSNFLSNTISVMDGTAGIKIKDIDLLADYNGVPLDKTNFSDCDGNGVIAAGALPIQTPVSPNGKYVVTANTLTATITIIDTDDDELEAMLACDAGCHGVNFGAKQGGGYYAYVTSKFANTLLVVDIDPNNDGEADDATIVGRLLLDAIAKTKTDDKVSAYSGMGGQGVLPVPNVYNGWVQNLPDKWAGQLTCEQRTPIDLAAIAEC